VHTPFQSVIIFPSTLSHRQTHTSWLASSHFLVLWFTLRTSAAHPVFIQKQHRALCVPHALNNGLQSALTDQRTIVAALTTVGLPTCPEGWQTMLKRPPSSYHRSLPSHKGCPTTAPPTAWSRHHTLASQAKHITCPTKTMPVWSSACLPRTSYFIARILHSAHPHTIVPVKNFSSRRSLMVGS
jgi:hypothetical protein